MEIYSDNLNIFWYLTNGIKIQDIVEFIRLIQIN